MVHLETREPAPRVKWPAKGHSRILESGLEFSCGDPDHGSFCHTALCRQQVWPFAVLLLKCKSPVMQALACLNSPLPQGFPGFKSRGFTAHVFLKPAPLVRKMLKIPFNSTHQMSNLLVEQSRKPGVNYPSQEATGWKDKVQMLLAWPPESNNNLTFLRQLSL